MAGAPKTKRTKSVFYKRFGSRLVHEAPAPPEIDWYRVSVDPLYRLDLRSAFGMPVGVGSGGMIRLVVDAPETSARLRDLRDFLRDRYGLMTKEGGWEKGIRLLANDLRIHMAPYLEPQPGPGHPPMPKSNVQALRNAVAQKRKDMKLRSDSAALWALIEDKNSPYRGTKFSTLRSRLRGSRAGKKPK